MGIPRRSWRLAGLAGCAAVVLGLAAGGSQAAALTQGQTLPVFNPNGAVSWGINDSGQLGDGSLAERNLFGAVSELTSGVVQVSAGGGYGLAITSGGTLWAWGANEHGQLGIGTTTQLTTPIQVTSLSGVRQVAAGFDHSLAVRSDGTVWAWGANDFGQLGIGVTGTPRLTPVEVPGLTGVTKIAAGFDFSLALRSDGTVWAWGTGGLGQLGNGSMASSPAPVQVSISQVTSIAAGEDAAYAIRSTTAGATLWAWGGNESGDLGDGSQAPHSTPEQVTGIADIAQVSAGNEFTVALVTNGSVWGWGDDQLGQLGNTPTHNLVARPIETVGGGSGITALSAGEVHVLALTSGGGVIAWGDNSEGELGDGNNAPVVGLVHVTGLSGASQVAAGSDFSLAVYKQPQIIP